MQIKIHWVPAHPSQNGSHQEDKGQRVLGRMGEGPFCTLGGGKGGNWRPHKSEQSFLIN